MEFLIVAAVVAFLIFLLPIEIAQRRKHHQRGAIIATVLLLSWWVPFVWFIALIWSMSAVKAEDPARSA